MGVSANMDLISNPLSANVDHARHKIIKNGLRVFERGENWLQNGILHFALNLSQSSKIVFQS